MAGNVSFEQAKMGAPPPKRINPQIFRLIAGFIVAGLLLVAFTRLVSLQGVLRRLEHLNIPIALLCGAVFLSAYVVRALRWRYFLAPYPVGRRQVILIYQVSIFVNWLLPVRGGELVKGILLRQQSQIPMSDSLPTVAMDKFMDLLPALILLAILPFMPFQLSGPLWALLLFVVFVVVGIAAFLALAVWKRALAMALLGRFFALFPRKLRERIEPFSIRFVDTLLALAARPRVLLIAAAYTAVAVCLDALFAQLAFLAVDAHIPFTVSLFGYTLYNLAYILPTPPGQIGSNEVIGLLVFSGLFAVSRISVASMFVFSHPWTALLMSASGMLSLAALGISLRSAFSMGKQPATDQAENAAPADVTQERPQIPSPPQTPLPELTASGTRSSQPKSITRPADPQGDTHSAVSPYRNAGGGRARARRGADRSSRRQRHVTSSHGALP